MRYPNVLAAVLLSLTLVAPAAADSPEAEYFSDKVQSKAPAPASASGDANGKLGRARMRKANATAAAISKKRMLRTRAQDLWLLRKAGAADIVVVSGSYDRVQDVLAAIDMKHVVIPPTLLDELELMATQTIMINCNNTGVTAKAIKNIESFVRRGGFLVTTDWALQHITQRAFPGTIAKGGRNTEDDVVAVNVHATDEPLLAHAKLHKDNPRWWLEGSSYPIKVLDPKRVKTLMSSPEMKKKYGEGAVAVSFRHDDGKVLHMTSHFYLQRSKLVAASEKSNGSNFAKAAGLSRDEIAQLKAEGLDPDDVSTGDLNSAYSMQQLSTNLLVSKQMANEKLLKKYSKRLKTRKRLDKKREMRKGFRVKVIKQKGDKRLVEDLFGNQTWVTAAELE